MTVRAAREAAPVPAQLRRVGTDRTSLREQVTVAVRSALVGGDMRPGGVYSVPTLAVRFGVSATPVREALLDLAKEGLLEPVRNKGFRVLVLSEADLDNIFRLRELLEVPSIDDVIRVATRADFASLRALARRIERFAADGDLLAYLTADREFHLGLLGMTGNERLVEIVGSLRSHVRLFGLAPMIANGQLGESAREHYRLVGLMSKGDAEGARALMRHHLRHTRGSWAGLGHDPDET